MTDKVIPFPGKTPQEQVTAIAEMQIRSDGTVSVWISNEDWSSSRYNWLLAKVAEGTTVILDYKAEHQRAQS